MGPGMREEEPPRGRTNEAGVTQSMLLNIQWTENFFASITQLKKPPGQSGNQVPEAISGIALAGKVSNPSDSDGNTLTTRKGHGRPGDPGLQY